MSVTVDSGSTITAVTVGGTACTAQDDGTYFCESGDMTYFITLSGGSTSYSYTCEEYFGASDTGYDGFVSLLSSLSDGCTIVLSPYLTSEQLEYFADALTASLLSKVTVDMSYMTITTISDKTFYQCKNLTSITIPDSVTAIDTYVFAYCSSLTSVTIGDSVTSIKSMAFYYCTSLTSVTIPDSVTSLGTSVFNGCTSLVTAVVGDGVEEIPWTTFYGCTSLKTVTIGSAVTTISAYSSSLSNSYGGAFGNCSALETVYYNGTTSDWGDISISSTSEETGNYYLTQATIICTDGTYTY